MVRIDVLEARLKILDKNGDGFLPVTEFENCMITYGLPKSDIQKLLHGVDRHKDGKIALIEITDVVKRFRVRRITSSELRRVFLEINTSRDGQITLSELKTYIIKFNPKVSESRIKALFKKYDGCQKGYLEYCDFV